MAQPRMAQARMGQVGLLLPAAAVAAGSIGLFLLLRRKPETPRTIAVRERVERIEAEVQAAPPRQKRTILQQLAKAAKLDSSITDQILKFGGSAFQNLFKGAIVTASAQETNLPRSRIVSLTRRFANIKGKVDGGGPITVAEQTFLSQLRAQCRIAGQCPLGGQGRSALRATERQGRRGLIPVIPG